MPTEPTDPWHEPATDEPTVPFHGQAAVPPSHKRPAPADLPVTAVPYQKPPRSAAVPMLSVLVAILLLLVVALVGHEVSSAGDARKKQDQLASQLAAEQRKVQELQAQVAAAKADAEKAKHGGDGDSQGAVDQLNSFSGALDGVLKARSGSDFSKAFEAMKSQCKIAGISLF